MPLRRCLLLALAAASWWGMRAAAAVEVPDLAVAERAIVTRANTFRRDEGLAPLSPAPALAAAARHFADFMARTERYGHEADGRTPVERARAQGYAWCLVAENIAMQFNSAGFATGELAERFMAGWIESPGHRRNLLDAAATETGVAIARAPRSERYYAVQVFGRPATLRLRFELSNRSPRDVSYRVGTATFVLPAGATRRHEQCRADPVELVRPDTAPPQRIAPADGARLRIEGSGRTLRLVGG